MSTETPSSILPVAVKAAVQAGEILKKSFGDVQGVEFKEDNTVVTEADKLAEARIIEILKFAFPDHNIFSEEGAGQKSSSPFLWQVDPLDGTSNFSRGIAHFNVSLALQKDGKTIAGVVYQPVTDELFYGYEGVGSFLNGRSLAIRDFSDIKKSFVVMNRGAGRAERDRHAKIYEHIGAQVRTMRVLSALALDICYTASGRFDALITNGSKPHDCAAGVLIAREAGAYVTNFSGGAPKEDEVDDYIIAGEKLHAALLQAMKEFSASPSKG